MVLQHYITHLFDTSGFMPRWMCGFWTPFAGWLYIISDFAIWAAYTSIPLTLMFFISKRKDIPFIKIFWLFAAFILACGSTHFADALMFWWPAYRFTGVIYFLTAVISWLTVLELIPIIPVALSLKSPTVLQREIDERIKTEKLLKEREEHERKIHVQLQQYAAQLESSNSELEAFTYSVSHDLRAPLRSIDGFSFAILENYDHLLDEEGKHYLARVRENSQYMGRLIDDMLKLSRLSLSDMRIESIELSVMVERIVEELREEDASRNVDFVVAKNIVVQGDKALLHSVMQNLMSNAWKYTSKHKTARIEFGVNTDNSEAPVYFVKDDGAGFDMAYVNKLFGTFQRLHKSSEFPGTGVGLAIVSRIIRRHKGKIYVEAEVEKGATFFFTLGLTVPSGTEVPSSI